MNHLLNLTRIKAVKNALGVLNRKVVFVGGATLSIYPDRPVLDIRPTDDIDVIIEILNYTSRTELESQLRANGFSHDIMSGIICRYRIHGIVVDIMPTTPESIGFSNRWYQEGFMNSIEYNTGDGEFVAILSAPYFLATKFEAFKGRGQGDGRISTDFEDIIFILENRSTIWQEMNATSVSVLEYLKNEILQLTLNPDIFEWVECHVERGIQTATKSILTAMRLFSA